MQTISITSEFEKALSDIRGGKNVLITGKAGTGKSTLLRTFLESVEQTDTNILVTAPTGVAALNIEGFTIHRTFGFRPGMFPDDIDPGGSWSPGRVAGVLKKIDILVVDEISMVRADLFDMMDKALRRVRESGEPFGGVQLILVGDLLQLPPVLPDSEREFFNERWDTPYFFSAHCYSDINLTEVTLTTVWRQSDPAFIEILNEIREGSVTEGTLATLNERVDPDFDSPEDWVTLTSYKRTVDAINDEKLAALRSEKFHSAAIHEGETANHSIGAQEELHYAIGAKVMTVINDPRDRFVNGSFGVIVDATPEVISVKIDESGEVVELRRHVWEIKRPTVNGGRLSSEVTGSISQFPVILAWAITIHKSQGKTIPKLNINLKGGTVTDGQFYVALSRAVDLDYLRLNMPVEERHIRANNSLVRRIRREVSNVLTTDRLVFVSFDGVDFGKSQHVARIHVQILQGGALVADFGSWINPMADLGRFGQTHSVPSGGLAMAPTLGDFWPLLLRQAAGGIVVGDRLPMLEHAVRHQEKGMEVALGVGYDIGEWEVVLPDGSVDQRCSTMVEAFRAGRIQLERGQVVPPAELHTEGAVYTPAWAPATPMLLDSTQATDSDVAWAAMSGGSLQPQDFGEVRECAELMAAWAISRGFWTEESKRDVVARANRISVGDIDLPAVEDSAQDLDSIFAAGTRVAFTGRNNLLGGPADDDRLREICSARGLEYKSGVSKSRCDVLVALDIASMSRKAQNAREYGKTIVAQKDFEEWYYSDSAVNRPLTNEVLVDSLESGAALESDEVPEVSVPIDSAPAALAMPEWANASELLHAGTRVAFRGSVFVDGKLHPHGEPLARLCEVLGLDYKQAVTKTRCDVLVSDDIEAQDGKSGLASRYNKPIVSEEDFSKWAAERLAERADLQDEFSMDVGVEDTSDTKPITEPVAIPADEEISDSEATDGEIYSGENRPADPQRSLTPAPEWLAPQPAMQTGQGFNHRPQAYPSHADPGREFERKEFRDRAMKSFKISAGVLGLVTVAIIGSVIAGAPVAIGAVLMLLWLVAAAGTVGLGVVAIWRKLR